MRVSKRPRERSFVGRFVSCCVGQENKGGGEKEGEGGTQRKRVIVKEKYGEKERERLKDRKRQGGKYIYI
jgi:hypothetical protein